MRAADKTIQFVKDWIAGRFTKRQYQNYYIVRTPNAEFLLKSTEARDLVAIKDNSDHIYLFDSDLYISDFDHKIRQDDGAMSNPFLCLINDGYPFAYTRISPQTVENCKLNNTISKWKTLDRVEVFNPSLPTTPLYISLIDVEGQRYIIEPVMSSDGRPSPATKMPLLAWAERGIEKSFKFSNPYVSYNINSLYNNTFTTVDEIRRNYVTIAGEALPVSWTSSEGWVFIPTNYETVEQITKRPFKEAKKLRPNPYAYSISSGLMNVGNLQKRWETIEENASAIKQCINLRDEVTSSDWRDVLRRSFLPEIADDFIEYFEADDKWLQEHFEIARAGALEVILRSKIALNLGGAIVYINHENNSSPLNEYVIYAKIFSKLGEKATFLKILPAPNMATKVKGVFNVDN
jgi:hypothetical protein